MAENLMEGILSEMNRVRDIIKEYEHPMLNGAGNLAAALMKVDIKSAEKAISSGNVIDMIVAYEKLKGYDY
jgi:hypothetical protein